MMTNKYFSSAYEVTMGGHMESKLCAKTFEENPKTGPNGGMGRLYMQPEHSNGGANENTARNYSP
jgi:hypothetical protein